MSRRKVEGICHICGVYGKLSFEHIPPEKAFNDHPVVRIALKEAIGKGPDDIIKGPIQQRGMGGYTLCEKCNNTTGSWYGRNFVNWCYQGMQILQKSGGNPSLLYLHYIYPLRILKQIVTMMFSVNNTVFHNLHPELVHFVLNKQARFLPQKYRFFVYFNVEGRPRTFGGNMATLDVFTGRSVIISEITFPPFGYVMAIESDPPDPRLFDITAFARYNYDEMRIMTLELPVLPTHVSMPGDYRSRDQIYKEAGIEPPPSN